MIHDFTITDLTPRPGHPSYYDAVLRMRVWCVAYRVVDASGAQVMLTRWCDTETGEVIRCDRSPDGVWKIDPATNRVMEIRERRPAPLRVQMLKPGEKYLLDGP